MKEVNRMKNNYKVDYAKNTITITKDFAKKANIIDSVEYKILRKLQKDFPNFTITQRTATVSTTKKTHKGLTLDRMEKYIRTFEEASDLKIFKKVKEYNTDYRENNSGELSEIINYGKVKAWFIGKYPEYEETEKMFEATIEIIEESEGDETETAKTGEENQELPLAS